MTKLTPKNFRELAVKSLDEGYELLLIKMENISKVLRVITKSTDVNDFIWFEDDDIYNVIAIKAKITEDVYKELDKLNILWINHSVITDMMIFGVEDEDTEYLMNYLNGDKNYDIYHKINLILK